MAENFIRQILMVNAAGDYVVSFIVSRFVDGKDWLQKKLHGAKTDAVSE